MRGGRERERERERERDRERERENSSRNEEAPGGQIEEDQAGTQ